MYSRTQNENGTYNTRCLYCFMTVASDVEATEELNKLETKHVCPERALAELLAQGSPCGCNGGDAGACDARPAGAR